MANIRSLHLLSPQELMSDISQRARQRRLNANLTQQGLADRAQVSLGSLKLFERTGKASLETVLLLAFALEAENEFESLFPAMTPRTIDDVIAKPQRQRGRRK